MIDNWNPSNAFTKITWKGECRLKGLIFTFLEVSYILFLNALKDSVLSLQKWCDSKGRFSLSMTNYLRILIIISGLNFIESSNYSDTCYYPDQHYPCGDICVNDVSAICNCGGENIRNTILDSLHFHYCCTPPSVKCKKKWYGASCAEGEVLEADHFYATYPEK